MASRALVIDVGATNTRIDDGTGAVHFKVGSVAELLECLGQFVVRGDSLVGGFAGVLAADRDSVCMTNWGGGELLQMRDLLDLGCGRVLLMNDLEASAWGLIELLERGGGVEVLALNGGRFSPDGNRVLVAPGTGLGSVGIVDLGAGAKPRWQPVACEFQHTQIPASVEFGAEFLGQAKLELGHPATWEDFVSGRGLELLFRLGCGGTATAAEVAGLALDGDADGGLALGRFYALVGQFGRSLAMAFMAHGGVFVAGSTTAVNMEFVLRGDLERGFQGSPEQPEFGLFGVARELNLAGAWRVLRGPGGPPWSLA